MTSSERKGPVDSLIDQAAVSAGCPPFNFENGMVSVDSEEGPLVCEPEAPLRDDRPPDDVQESSPPSLVGFIGSSEATSATSPSRKPVAHFDNLFRIQWEL